MASPLRVSLGNRIVCLHEFQVSGQNRPTGGFEVVLSFSTPVEVSIYSKHFVSVSVAGYRCLLEMIFQNEYCAHRTMTGELS
ncbi:hypothetical protein DET57_1233 [Klebsiella oxytoca]|uniref:Uncharacterized protein n=1 Tax=Klebsiella oxytoca TaxID=571 RepID=A0A318FMB7_KLEOX|nr:hypothetical protein DET57_1233 [Klebsiella oxytoca]